MCQKYGKVEHIKIYYDPLTKKHAGKARVTFDLTKSAKLACTKLNAFSVMGNIISTQLEPNLKGLYSLFVFLILILALITLTGESPAFNAY